MDADGLLPASTMNVPPVNSLESSGDAVRSKPEDSDAITLVMPPSKRMKLETLINEGIASTTTWAQSKSPLALRSPAKGEAVTAAAVAAAAAPGVGTGGLVAEVEPRPDFSFWTVDDDLQLLHAMETGLAMEALAKGALRFSQRFSVKELRARWRALLYDPDIAPLAAAKMVAAEAGAGSGDAASRPRKPEAIPEMPADKRMRTVRKCWYRLKEYRCQRESQNQNLSTQHFPQRSSSMNVTSGLRVGIPGGSTVKNMDGPTPLLTAMQHGLDPQSYPLNSKPAFSAPNSLSLVAAEVALATQAAEGAAVQLGQALQDAGFLEGSTFDGLASMDTDDMPGSNSVLEFGDMFNLLAMGGVGAVVGALTGTIPEGHEPGDELAFCEDYQLTDTKEEYFMEGGSTSDLGHGSFLGTTSLAAASSSQRPLCQNKFVDFLPQDPLGTSIQTTLDGQADGHVYSVGCVPGTALPLDKMHALEQSVEDGAVPLGKECDFAEEKEFRPFSYPATDQAGTSAMQKIAEGSVVAPGTESAGAEDPQVVAEKARESCAVLPIQLERRDVTMEEACSRSVEHENRLPLGLDGPANGSLAPNSKINGTNTECRRVHPVEEVIKAGQIVVEQEVKQNRMTADKYLSVKGTDDSSTKVASGVSQDHMQIESTEEFPNAPAAIEERLVHEAQPPVAVWRREGVTVIGQAEPQNGGHMRAAFEVQKCMASGLVIRGGSEQTSSLKPDGSVVAHMSQEGDKLVSSAPASAQEETKSEGSREPEAKLVCAAIPSPKYGSDEIQLGDQDNDARGKSPYGQMLADQSTSLESALVSVDDGAALPCRMELIAVSTGMSEPTSSILLANITSTIQELEADAIPKLHLSSSPKPIFDTSTNLHGAADDLVPIIASESLDIHHLEAVNPCPVLPPGASPLSLSPPASPLSFDLANNQGKGLFFGPWGRGPGFPCYFATQGPWVSLRPPKDMRKFPRAQPSMLEEKGPILCAVNTQDLEVPVVAELSPPRLLGCLELPELHSEIHHLENRQLAHVGSLADPVSSRQRISPPPPGGFSSSALLPSLVLGQTNLVLPGGLIRGHQPTDGVIEGEGRPGTAPHDSRPVAGLDLGKSGYVRPPLHAVGTPGVGSSGRDEAGESTAHGEAGGMPCIGSGLGFGLDVLEGGDDPESDDELLNFSDVEAMILDMDLDPGDEAVSTRLEARRLYKRQQRAAIRLEAAVAGTMQRMLCQRGALAILYGRHLRFLMTKVEVSLGRRTQDNVVDIDVGKEGRANKVSRRQAFIKLKEDGIFYLRNVGRRALTVNKNPIESGQRAILGDKCLIEVGGMRLIFEINQQLVKSTVARMRAMRGRNYHRPGHAL